MSSDLFASVILPVFLAFIAICCCTRFITGRQYKSALSDLSTRSVSPTLPYWVPFLGHFFILFPVPTQRWRVDSTSWGLPSVYLLNVCGRNYTVINGIETVRTLLEKPSKPLSWVKVRWHILQHVFGAKARHRKSYGGISNLSQAPMAVLPSEEKSCAMKALIRTIEERAPEIVSLNESIVDQHIWEREACVTVEDLSEGRLTAHANLFTLIKGFVSNTTTSSMIGEPLADQPGSFMNDIWHLERSWKYLALGPPSWFPLPSTLPARGACRRLRLKIQSLLEIGHDNVDEYSAPFQERMKTYTINNTPIEVQASLDLSLLWNAIVQSSCLTFWMLLHIFQTPDLAHALRYEIKDHVQAIEPENAFRLPEPRRVSVNVEGLMSSCTTLRKCLDECIRLYADGTAVLEAEKPFTLISPQTPHRTSTGYPASQTVKVQAGDTLILDLASHGDLSKPFDPARSLSDLSTTYQECMTVFQAPELGRGAGTGPAATSIRTESRILVTVAAVISLWDIEPVGKTGWEVPRSRWNSMLASPASEVRVAIKPRKLS